MGVLGFSTIFVMKPSLVGHHHAEALVVLDFLGPDDPVGVGAVDEGEVGLEDRVDEDDQHGLLHEGPREVDRARRPILDLLLDEPRRPAIPRARVALHLLLEVARDEDQLRDVEALEAVHHPVHDGATRDLEQRLRDQVGVRPEPRALARQGDDDLHVSSFRIGR
jgi:hypothetical protein